MCLLTLAATRPLAAQEKAAAGNDAKKITYDEHVRPIFRAKCFSCHSTDKKTADLDLSNYTAMMQGGASGTAIEPGAAADSYLFMLVNHDSEPYMPPKSDKLPDEMVATIRTWIDLGAPENAGSKVMVKKKADLTLDAVPTGKPEGPAAMPRGVLIDPVVHTTRPAAVKALATSPWAPLVAMAAPQQIVLYDSQTDRVAGVLPFPEGDPYVLRFSRNGELLMAAGGRGAASGKAVVYRVRTGERLFDVGDELDAVLAADISSDQSMIAIGGTNRIVRVYSTSTGEVLYEIRKHTDWITALEFSPDGVLLATADRNGGMHVWEGYTGRLYSTLDGHKAATTGVSWRADSNILASSSEDGTVKLWEMENGKAVQSWNAHGGGALSVEFARDGRVLSSGRDKVCKLWAADGKQLVAFPAFADIATRSTFDDETNRAIAGDLTGVIRAWNAADAQQTVELTSNPRPLDQLLAESQTELQAAKAAADKAMAEYQAVVQLQQKTTAELETARKTMAEQAALAKKLATDLAGLQKALEAVTARHQAELNQMTALQKAEPLLAESLKQTTAAAAALQDDKELAASVESLKKLLAARQASLKSLQGTVPKLAANKDAAAKQVETTIAGQKAAEAQVAALTKSIEVLTKSLAEQEPKVAMSKSAADTAQAQFSSVEERVKRLQAYTELRGELQTLAQHQTQLEELQVGLNGASEQVKQAESNRDAMATALTQSNDELTKVQKSMAVLQATIQATQTQVQTLGAQKAALDKAVPVLAETLARSQAAASLLPQDQQVAALAKTAGELLKQKQAEVAETAKQMAAAEQKQAADTKALAVAAELAKSTEQKIADLQKKHQEALANVQKMQQVMTAASQQVEAAQKQVDQVLASVEQLRNRVSPQIDADSRASAN